MSGSKIVVVVPCYRAASTVVQVVRGLLACEDVRLEQVICVDDACPEASGDRIVSEVRDSRVIVLRHDRNGGVGAATVTGYRAALASGAEIVVKVDADGQMRASDLSRLVDPILRGRADYSKGNRFFRLRDLRSMPTLRLVGNAGLSFLSKLSSGYWDIFDPTNGFTAIHRIALAQLDLDRVARRYFFESDLLFRLGLERAVVVDTPIEAVYRGEPSSLRPLLVLPEFALRHLARICARIFYQYFLREFSVASVELVLGLVLFAFGAAFGVERWAHFASLGQGAPIGTVMLAAVPVLLGVNLLLAFLGYDTRPKTGEPLQIRLASPRN